MPTRLLVLLMITVTGSTSVVFALLAKLQDTYRLPTWGLGLMSAAAFVAGFAVQLVAAPFADRGHARTLLLAGLALAVVSNVAFALGSSLVVFTAARACTGAAYGMFGPAARAMIATAGDDASAGERLGRLVAAEMAGFTLGPAVGVVLVGATGLRGPFVFFALPPLLALPILARRNLPALAAAASTRPSITLVADPAMRVALLLAFTGFVPVGLYDALWARYLADRGASTLFIGLSLTLFSVPFGALATVGGRFADRRGPLRTALIFLAATVPLTVLYGVLRRPVLVVAAALVESVLQAVAVPATQAALALAAPPGRAATAQGLGGAAGLLGAATLSLVAAPIYGATTHWVVFATTGAMVGALLVGVVVVSGGLRSALAPRAS